MNKKFPASTWSTRARLALLAIACIVPSLVLSVLLIVHQYRNEREHLIKSSIATAHSMSEMVDRDLASMESALLTLSTSPQLTAGDLEGFQRQAMLALPLINANNIYLTDATGQQLMNTLRPYGEPLPVSGNLKLIFAVFKGEKSVFSDLFNGALAKKPVVAVGVPVLHQGRIVYMLGATLQPKRLTDVLKRQPLPEGWVASVIDGSGAIVSRTRQLERFQGAIAPERLLRAIAAAPLGSVEVETLERVPSIAVYARSSVSSWTVGVLIPKQELIRDLWTSIGLVAGTSSLVFAAGLILAWKQGDKITSAIESLIGPAAALGRNEGFVIPPSGVDEVDRVARALAQASSVLEKTQYEAHHDKLTGLANRTLFEILAERQLAVAQRNGRTLALLFIDLDGFKRVNDTHGHTVGDDLLRDVARRLGQTVRRSDIAARLGGDEFAVVLIDTDLAGAVAVSEKLIEALSAPYEVQSHRPSISASVGVAVYPDAADALEHLMLRADEAMYLAKLEGKNRYRIASL